MTSTCDLSNILKACQNHAKTGYNLANKACDAYELCLQNSMDFIDKTILNIKNQPGKFNQLNRLLKSHKNKLSQLSTQLQNEKLNLEQLYKSQIRFSIALFGRTMTGKSTLSEILTQGDGQTIGKGKQRTTLNVNHYTWQNLDIVDMPGIAAFNGQEDEEKALNAAKNADLILFMLTDDGTQNSEADDLKKLVQTGKPIIFLINLKHAVSGNLKYDKYKIQSCFNEANLGGIRTQFLEYGKQYGQNWESFPFVYVHLLSAFKAQHESDQERADALYKLSHLDDLISIIREQVIDKGRFYKIKTFADAVAKIVCPAEDLFFKMGTETRKKLKETDEKKDSFCYLKSDLNKNGKQYIQNHVKQIRTSILQGIPDFVDANYQNSNWNEAWEEHLMRLKIQSRTKHELSCFIQQCQKWLANTSLQIKDNQSFSCDLSGSKYLELSKIYNWGILGGILSGGTQIASFVWPQIKPFYPLLMSVGSWLGHKDYKTKVKEAKQKLKQCLVHHANKICEQLESTMNHVIMLLSLKLENHIHDLSFKHDVLSECIHTHIQSAQEIHKLYKKLNMKMLKDGCEDLKLETNLIKIAGRIPGNICALWCRENGALSENDRKQLESRLSEQIMIFPVPSENTEIITQLLSEYDKNGNLGIELDPDYPMAYLPKIRKNESIRTRISLIQQITQLGILEK